MADSKSAAVAPKPSTNGTYVPWSDDALRCAYDTRFSKSLELTPTDSDTLNELYGRVQQALVSACAAGRLPGYKELVKGGSSAKGTAVHGLSRDMDLVALFELPFDPVSEKEYQLRLDQLKAAVRTYVAGAEEVERKHWLISFGFQLSDVGVDLLVGRALTDAERKDTNALFGRLNEPVERKRLSASVSCLQAAWVAGQSAEVKTAIRMTKWWRDQCDWTTVCGKPVSYLLELLVVHASTLLRTTATARQVFLKLLNLLAEQPQQQQSKQLQPHPNIKPSASSTSLSAPPWRIAFTRPAHPTAYYDHAAVDWKALGDVAGWAVVDVANPTNLVNFQFKSDGIQRLLEYAHATLAAIARYYLPIPFPVTNTDPHLLYAARKKRYSWMWVAGSSPHLWPHSGVPPPDSWFAERFGNSVTATQKPVRGICTEAEPIFIDRDPKTFEYVLNYLRDGHDAVLPMSGLAGDGTLAHIRERLIAEARFYRLSGLVQLAYQGRDRKVESDAKTREVELTRLRALKVDADARAQREHKLWPERRAACDAAIAAKAKADLDKSEAGPLLVAAEQELKRAASAKNAAAIAYNAEEPKWDPPRQHNDWNGTFSEWRLKGDYYGRSSTRVDPLAALLSAYHTADTAVTAAKAKHEQAAARVTKADADLAQATAVSAAAALQWDALSRSVIDANRTATAATQQLVAAEAAGK